ncbi:phytanoyl-CoA dioxygenase family protein [Burkholderia sp. AU31624]|uniref:phytanoyl-CoA dioxygenase family protein n=1 Tax=Burkholderia sp. AU31624 TaxID=2879629 RepID=UPI001CF213DE|nr:phytanoyl-CoA dioxygenase family protein [Burkholderia sp. AU31624]MCA8256873.1 phytanoyl-CoA dioxygenase family protein [Burkholderia sp. AU31624]
MDESKRKAFRENGAVLMEGLLNEDQLATCRQAFNWGVENPGPMSVTMFDGTEHKSLVDNANPYAKARLDEMVAALPLGRMFAELWGSKNVWYFAEELFLKEGGKAKRSPWHQDTSYLPWQGEHFGNAWISFEAVPKKNALEIVKASHRGVRHDGTTFQNADDPTDPLHGDAAVPTWPRLPNIEAERRADPEKYDIASWATTPGDVLVLHPHSLHGGGSVDADFPDRHTLVLRFFGDDAVYSPLPEGSRSGYTPAGVLFVEELAHLKAGDPFRAPCFRQVV